MDRRCHLARQLCRFAATLPINQFSIHPSPSQRAQRGFEMTPTAKRKSSLRELQAELRSITEAAARSGLQWTGSQEPFTPWTDVWQYFPQRPSDRWPLERATIHTSVADMGSVQVVTVPSQSFVRLHLQGLGMTHAERVLWHEMTTDMLEECGLSPLRADWICACESPDVFETLEHLLRGELVVGMEGDEGCSLAYSFLHWEVTGDGHGKEAHFLLDFLSTLLLFTRMTACLSLASWKIPGCDGWFARPDELLGLLDHYRAHYPQPLRHDGDVHWRLEYDLSPSPVLRP